MKKLKSFVRMISAVSSLTLVLNMNAVTALAGDYPEPKAEETQETVQTETVYNSEGREVGVKSSVPFETERLGRNISARNDMSVVPDTSDTFQATLWFVLFAGAVSLIIYAIRMLKNSK